jgi:SAM-dependent methyltransferase
MKKPFYQRSYCCLCRSTHIECVIPLAPVPCASPNVGIGSEAYALGAQQTLAPLDIYLCRDCGHVQLVHIVDPALQYTNYRYTTSVSLGLRRHFETLVADVTARLAPKTTGLVLEIGSNDGTVLSLFKERGFAVQGVDPAREIAARATAAGIPTIGDFFTSALSERLVAEQGKADAIIANNVIANIDDLSDLVAGIRGALAPDGIFVFETGYGADVITKTLLDTVYHEHISYFMVRSLKIFFAQNGLELIDAGRILSKGGSLRGVVQLRNGPRKPSPNVDAMIAAEIAEGLDQPPVYLDFAQRVNDIRQCVQQHVDDQSRSGPVAGYGASVGTVTLLNFFGMADRLRYIADDSPLTTELRGPGYAIPVVKSEHIYEELPSTVLVFAWRYIDPIVERHQRYLKQGGSFIVPLPSFSIRHG